ncbi:MAG: hypothetical protein IK088_01705 [Lachnospiraceae bacterium]|nr:hypothetical protein [Lachnospiraceae bacterium]
MNDHLTLMTSESVSDTIYRLIDEFPYFGHFYGNDGRLLKKYRHLQYRYSENGEPVLCSAIDGTRIRPEGFRLYNLSCNQTPDDGSDAPYDDWESGSFSHTFRYLNIHSGNSNEFRKLLREDVQKLSVHDIRRTYLTDPVMNMLIAMLRHGRNYASKEPVPETFDDRFLRERIALTWKAILIGTLDARDLANAQTFLSIEYADLFRGTNGERRMAEKDSSDSVLGLRTKTEVFLPYAGKFAKERLSRVQAERSCLTSDPLSVLLLDASTKDDAALRKIDETALRLRR